MKRAFVYVRISKESDSQLGLESQEHACRDFAKQNGYEVIALEKDVGVSGRTEPSKRDGLMSLLGQMDKGDTLFIAKRDRLGRDQMHLNVFDESIRKQKLNCVDVSHPHLAITDDSSPQTKAFRAIMDAIAELEVNMIRARTRVAMAQKKRKGYRIGHIPFGYKADEEGKITPVPKEQALLDMMIAYHGMGMSLNGIATKLNTFSQNRLGPWNKMSISRNLKNLEAHRKAYIKDPLEEPRKVS